jgi:ElaB/YqjD/DUF883 family membrane-anchored ribosome-binding protein
MNHRIPDYLLNPKNQIQKSQSTAENFGLQMQETLTAGVRQIATYVKEHPTTGIGVALCLGAFLGWAIKRR